MSFCQIWSLIKKLILKTQLQKADYWTPKTSRKKLAVSSMFYSLCRFGHLKINNMQHHWVILIFKFNTCTYYYQHTLLHKIAQLSVYSWLFKIPKYWLSASLDDLKQPRAPPQKPNESSDKKCDILWKLIVKWKYQDRRF